MGWRYWDDYPRERRRPAHGIKARTQRGKFGQTWWAGQWIAALERLVDSARLSRGRSYARSGQVLELDVGPQGVRAKVQGSRATPYTVRVQFRTLSPTEWDKVTDAMAEQALYAARLLAGEMPERIEDVFRAAGTNLFPAATNDLMTDCSCPDWANPCKHVAAVHYLLGERFDDDPFLLFVLRGRSKEAIAAELRARRAGGTAPEEQPAAEQPDQAAEEDVPLLGERADEFWSMPDDLAALTTTFKPPPVDALPVKQRGIPPFWKNGDDFEAVMEEMYRSIADRAQSMVIGDEREG